MAQQSILESLAGAADKLDRTLDSAEIGMTGGELSTMEEVIAELRDVEKLLKRLVQTVGSSAESN